MFNMFSQFLACSMHLNHCSKIVTADTPQNEKIKAVVHCEIILAALLKFEEVLPAD